MIPAYHSAMSNPVEIAARLADDGVYLKDKADAEAFQRVHERTGDPDIAADVVLLVSRPEWLSDLIGDRLRPKAAA